jgi:hypothetical protein
LNVFGKNIFHLYEFYFTLVNSLIGDGESQLAPKRVVEKGGGGGGWGVSLRNFFPCGGFE